MSLAGLGNSPEQRAPDLSTRSPRRAVPPAPSSPGPRTLRPFLPGTPAGPETEAPRPGAEGRRGSGLLSQGPEGTGAGDTRGPGCPAVAGEERPRPRPRPGSPGASARLPTAYRRAGSWRHPADPASGEEADPRGEETEQRSPARPPTHGAGSAPAAAPTSELPAAGALYPGPPARPVKRWRAC